MLSTFGVLVQIAFRNLRGSLLNLFVGSIIFFGTVLLVVGGSIFETLDQALSKSIVGSTTAHLQIYSSASKDPLEIYGKFDGADSMLAPIDDFPALKAKLLEVPNVRRVVPMGTSGAMLGSGNTVDVTLGNLRALYRDRDEGRSKLDGPAFARESSARKEHVRQIVQVLLKDLENTKELGKENDDPFERDALATAGSDAFWASFDADPFGHLELLENKVSPQVADADLLFIRYLGTDLETFQATFDRMEIADGERVPPGKRGMLIPKFFYEEFMKLKNARRLDKIRDALEAGRRLSDSRDTELQRFVRENVLQTREFVLQLDRLKTGVAVEKLQKLLGSGEPDFAKLLTSFFAVTDQNFAERYRFFYAELAPMLELYRVRIGDSLSLTSFSRSGSVASVNVKVYGTFQFKGLEKSPLSGALALIDLNSFRDLYGFLTPELAAELKAMKAAVKPREVTRANAEDELFGATDEAAPAATQAPIAETPLRTRRAAAVPDDHVATREEIESGVVLHVAVQLEDASPAAAAKAHSDIEKLLAAGASAPATAAAQTLTQALEKKQVPLLLARSLEPVLAVEKARATGGPLATQATLLELQQMLKVHRGQLPPEVEAAATAVLTAARPALWVVDWDAAAGTLGQFIGFFKLALGLIVVVVALIAVIILMIGITIATLQRTQTIGTIRAIGGQREFVLAMVVVESLVLSLVFAGLGIFAGAAIVTWLGHTGIPAFRDELYFFFSGPRLLPQLTRSSITTAVVMIVVATLISVLVPAYIATRISPLRAMQGAE